MKITTVGIDLAKNVFAVHGVNEHGRTVLRKVLKRDQIATFFVNLPTCLIGMEACSSAHYWARKLQSMGHTVRLIAPQFVKHNRPATAFSVSLLMVDGLFGCWFPTSTIRFSVETSTAFNFPPQFPRTGGCFDTSTLAHRCHFGWGRPFHYFRL